VARIKRAMTVFWLDGLHRAPLKQERPVPRRARPDVRRLLRGRHRPPWFITERAAAGKPGRQALRFSPRYVRKFGTISPCGTRLRGGEYAVLACARAPARRAPTCMCSQPLRTGVLRRPRLSNGNGLAPLCFGREIYRKLCDSRPRDRNIYDKMSVRTLAAGPKPLS